MDTKQEKSKLWLVKDYVDYPQSENPSNTRTQPEKYLLKEWLPRDKVEPVEYKEIVGLVYEHPGGEVTGLYPIVVNNHKQTNALLKKLLTFVDATVAEKSQKDATKKLITRMVWDHHNETIKDLEGKIPWANTVALAGI